MNWLTILLMLGTMTLAAEEPLTIAAFRVDATPPLGSALCDGLVPPAEKIVDPLSARGSSCWAHKSR
ncbi:MAG: hypothetical protein AAB225_09245 [Acidobacteriota bacterium]